MEPVIVQTPVYQKSNPARSSKASDGKSVGSGIFQFREARASEQTLVNEEAPVPRPFSTSKPGKITHSVSYNFEVIDRSPEFFTGAEGTDLAIRAKTTNGECQKPGHAWSVYCNNCDIMMDNAHYHCSICDDGDYDLCEECVAGGKLCPGEGHWLIRRIFQNGSVISSTTERLPPKYRAPTTEEKEMHAVPGAFKDEKFTPAQPTRTCNCCVIVLPENAFVTCNDCADYDLCIPCHANNLHGHHPAHSFKPATETTVLSTKATSMLPAGRNARHNAICDGCDKNISGVRHKCLDCPDWDFCNNCINRAPSVHPRHRFAAIYSPITDVRIARPTHSGIYCDGPLCAGSDQAYIKGVRYKCAVCHDTDFCASCEALPTNHHNRTHPLIKFKTPVHGVTINTMNQEPSGRLRTLGDKRAQSAKAETRSTSTETTPAEKSNAATQVQTVADFKPTEDKSRSIPVFTSEKKIEEAKPQPIPVFTSRKKDEEQKPIVPTVALDAHFVYDTISDGSGVGPGHRFIQVWYLRNPGPAAWPAGCSVRYVGGDNMLDVDNGHPASVSDIANAAESNVCGREVQVGEVVGFKVVMKAPVRLGKAISYWRLKAADGTAFGHRLWCDVEVTEQDEDELAEGSKNGGIKDTLTPSTVPSKYEDAYRASHERLETLRQQQAAIVAQRQQTQALQQQAQAQAQAQAYQQHLQMQAVRMQQMSQTQQVMSRPQYSSVPFDQASQATQYPGVLPHQGNAPVPQTVRDQWFANMNALRSQTSAQGTQQSPYLQGAMSRPDSRMPQPSLPVPVPTMDAYRSRLDAASLERKEAAKLRVEAIKSKIMKAREAKAKAMEEVRDNGSAAKKTVAETSEAQQQDEEANGDVEGSQMVFPRLDKESPASSTYQSASSSASNLADKSKGKAATVETDAGELEKSATSAAIPAAFAAAPDAAPVTTAFVASAPQTPAIEEGFEDLTDDLEVLSADGEDSGDNGFLTDEEYDILDASDQETVASS